MDHDSVSGFLAQYVASIVIRLCEMVVRQVQIRGFDYRVKLLSRITSC